ncbi:MAG TPA: aspartate 1-decarboxylase [Bryobacteraceae bacterium]|nr:aspartate 1-decarboxylase [Bryobacteraceae bacterium]
MRLRVICKSKIHRATVTEANLDYIGSIAIDESLMKRCDIVPGEQVSIWNLNNGERIETYAIPAPPGSGEIMVNGAAARRFQPKDKIIIAAFAITDEPVQPKMILVDERNRFLGDLADNQDLHSAEVQLTAPGTKRS